MKSKNGEKFNISVSLTSDELECLENLVTYFQMKSPATITKTDVVSFLVKKTEEARRNKDEAYFEDLLNIDLTHRIGRIDRD